MTDYKVKVKQDGCDPFWWTATVFRNDAPTHYHITHADWTEVYDTHGCRTSDDAQRAATEWIERQTANYEFNYTPKGSNND